ISPTRKSHCAMTTRTVSAIALSLNRSVTRHALYLVLVIPVRGTTWQAFLPTGTRIHAIHEHALRSIGRCPAGARPTAVSDLQSLPHRHRSDSGHGPAVGSGPGDPQLCPSGSLPGRRRKLSR